MVTEFRRVARRAHRYSLATVIAAAVYVGGFVNTSAATGWGIVSHETARRLDVTLYAPMRWYTASALPGGHALQHARDWCYWVCQNVRP